jgi:hypothetical protein
MSEKFWTRVKLKRDKWKFLVFLVKKRFFLLITKHDKKWG